MEFIDLNEAGKTMHHTGRWVKRTLIDGGLISAAKFGARWMIRRQDFERFVARMTRAGTIA